jgi:hypothetical protein
MLIDMRRTQAAEAHIRAAYNRATLNVCVFSDASALRRPSDPATNRKTESGEAQIHSL